MLGCRATKELKKAEEDARDAELSAAEVRGKLEAEKEALMADRLAAERLAEQHQEAAKQCEVELANYKACSALGPSSRSCDKILSVTWFQHKGAVYVDDVAACVIRGRSPLAVQSGTDKRGTQLYKAAPIKGCRDRALDLQARAHSLLKSKEAELRAVRDSIEAASNADLAEARAAAQQAQQEAQQVAHTLPAAAKPAASPATLLHWWSACDVEIRQPLVERVTVLVLQQGQLSVLRVAAAARAGRGGSECKRGAARG